MNIVETLSSFAVVGVIVSLVIEYSKPYFTNATPTLRTIYGLLLSVIGGSIIYVWHLIPGAWITDAIGVIAAVNTAYVFLVQYLPNGNVPTVDTIPPAAIN
jgi:hypothetical protein